MSAALVLPPDELAKGESLRDSFERDGRWSLLSLGIYFLLAIGVDWLFWHVSPTTLPGVLLVPLITLPIVFLSTKSRRAQEVVTVLYVPLSAWSAWALSPAYYS